MPDAPVPDWGLRPIAADDYEWAYSLHKAALGEYVERTWGWNEEFQRLVFADAFAREARQVIRVADEDVGVLVVEERPDELYLGLIELAPAWQGRGIGGEIVRGLLVRASDGGRALGLHALAANPRAIGLYERLGLRIVESDGIRVRMRAG